MSQKTKNKTGACHARLTVGSSEWHVVNTLRAIHEKKGDYSFIDFYEMVNAIDDISAKYYVRDPDTGILDGLIRQNIVEMNDDSDLRIHPEHWMPLKADITFMEALHEIHKDKGDYSFIKFDEIIPKISNPTYDLRNPDNGILERLMQMEVIEKGTDSNLEIRIHPYHQIRLQKNKKTPG